MICSKNFYVSSDHDRGHPMKKKERLYMYDKLIPYIGDVVHHNKRTM